MYLNLTIFTLSIWPPKPRTFQSRYLNENLNQMKHDAEKDQQSVDFERCKRAFHAAQIYQLGLIFSPKLYKTFQEALDSQYHLQGPYQTRLDELASKLLETAPEIRYVLRQPDGTRALAQFLFRAVHLETKERFTDSQLLHIHSFSESVSDYLEKELQKADAKGDELSDLGDALDADIDTVSLEPWRMRETFPPGSLRLHHKELDRLNRVVGYEQLDPDSDIDGWVQVLLPELIRLALDPLGLKGGGFRADSPVWRWMGMESPSRDKRQMLAIYLVD